MRKIWKHKNVHSSGSWPSQKKSLAPFCGILFARSHGHSPGVIGPQITKEKHETKTRTKYEKANLKFLSDFAKDRNSTHVCIATSSLEVAVQTSK